MSRSPQDSRRTTSLQRYMDGWHATGLLLKRGKSFSGHERNCAYLNCGTPSSEPRFANISAASGLDFPDDGRGLAVVDWDHDGDLDLWLSNRTAPRLRLMRNDTSTSSSRFVALRLQGTKCNRDAVGARVALALEETSSGVRSPKSAGTRQAVLVQTLHAGDGFLSQSSKWLHFGLGDSRIDRVIVRWPGGQTESFTGVAPGGRYLLQQGRGQAEQLNAQPRSVVLEPSTQIADRPADTSHVLLPVRFPLPVLPYIDLDGTTKREVKTRSRPLLVNFWASWCLPCVAELKQWTERDSELGAAGLDVLSLSVDGLGQNQSTTATDAQALLERIDFAFDSGLATAELLDKVEKVQAVLFDRTPPFAVPLSFLLDDADRLAAVYRGPVEVEKLLRDVANLDVSPQRRYDSWAPFEGRWVGSAPVVVELSPVEHSFDRYPTDALMYLELALKQQDHYRQLGVDQELIDRNTVDIHHRLAKRLKESGGLDPAMEHCQQALSIDPNHVGAQLILAELLSDKGEPTKAIALFEVVLQKDPTSAAAPFGLGLVYGQTGRFEEAAEMFEKALAVDPERAETYINLGKAREHLGRPADAIEPYLAALNLDPQQAELRQELRTTLFRLGMTHAQAGRYEQAAEMFEHFVNARPDDAEAHFNLATLSQRLGQFDRAIDHLTEAVRLRPKAFQLQFNLGALLARVDRVSAALQAYAKAQRLKPQSPAPLNGMAWLLATHPDTAVRDAAEAVRLAQRAAELTEHQAPEILDTLAAAYATAGQFDQAVTTAQQAIALAADQVELADLIRHRLKLYQQHKPYREPVAKQRLIE